jgi:hypothetical protein
MGDSDFNVATLELTKEILKELGIPSSLTEAYPDQPTQASLLIDEYTKYFRQLRLGLTTSSKE